MAWVAVLALGTLAYVVWPRVAWSHEEQAALSGLWLGKMAAPPPDPSNAVADDPRAVKLGHRLFFDKRLSLNGQVSCATCHMPERNFNDGLPLAKGVGTTTRKTMTVVGAAYSPWLFWDGRKDSLWAQALGPLESPVEHGGTRTQYAHLIERSYRAEYEALFGPLPDFSDHGRFPEVAGPVEDPVARAAWKSMTEVDREAVTLVYANMGKAIAAYERKLAPGPSRFDRYVEALLRNDTATMREILTPSEVAGARLFIGKAECINCHNGPLLMGSSFHNTGVPGVAGLPIDRGRLTGVQQALEDEFNCLSRWSDAGPGDCAELRFAARSGAQLDGAFKPPTLRNIAQTAPYMHAGQFANLGEVLRHYNAAKPGPVGHSELHPLGLSEAEMEELVAFLGSLNGPPAVPPELLRPPPELSASPP